MREKPGAQEQRHRRAQRLVAVDGDHVGARHHDLARDGVAELEDRVDHLALAGLDQRALARQVDQVAQLGLALERAVAVAAPRRHRVAEGDEQAGERAEDPAQPDEHRRGEQGDASACWRPRVRGETPTTTNDTTAMTPMATSSGGQKPSTRSTTREGDQHRGGRPRRPPAGTRRPTGMPRCRRRCATSAVGAGAALLEQLLRRGPGTSASSAASAAASRKASSDAEQRGQQTSPVIWRADQAAGRPRPGEEGEQQLALELEHLALLLGLRVVVAEQVQDAVRRQQQQLLLGRVAGLGGLLGRDGRAEHDVAEDALLGLRRPRGRGAARPSGSSSRRWARAGPSTARGAPPSRPRRPGAGTGRRRGAPASRSRT